ncbi:MAG: helix-hairpin-helix domain-containing protein, partial [Candidatus Omnitrophica bacterium]|nr:helix-hairpin-helix domain-containing protein [Candidatus Omnitrophota bacterium]
LEVPEIYEGIVEIKSISRQPGERTKIAVCSKNDKVDSVGACVGMRGNRVRNIVGELQGEKIDIVRYSDDIREYIRAALSPAEVSEIKLDKDQTKAEVIVNDDQLSLAIGKHGQNVRLASRLIGWELDIRTRETAQEAAETPAAAAQEEEPVAAVSVDAARALARLGGVGVKTIESLRAAGFASLEDVANAEASELTAVKGIGQKKAEKLITEARTLLSK